VTDLTRVLRNHIPFSNPLFSFLMNLFYWLRLYVEFESENHSSSQRGLDCTRKEEPKRKGLNSKSKHVVGAVSMAFFELLNA
jgi:hypothetical protein